MTISNAPLVPLDRLEPFGRDLHRPECVLTTASGAVFASDWRGGVTIIRPDGSQDSRLVGADAFALRPNAVALTPDGAFLIAHLGETGGVWHLGHDGRLAPWLTEVDGVPLPPTNFVTRDEHGRSWVSVSTRRTPRQLAWRPDVADGFVVLSDARGTRIVADGLHYTNEVRPDPAGRWLWVVETFGRRLVRFPIRADGGLGAREIVVALSHGDFPDGFAFDEEGGIWITNLVSNRLLWVHNDTVDTVIEDSNPAFIAAAKQAFASGAMTAEHLGPIPGTRLQQITSVAFGGADLRTVYLGSLHGTCLYRFRSAIAGAPPVHWTFRAP